MLNINELDKGKIIAMHVVKRCSFTMIKCLILKYFGGNIKNDGKQFIDPFT